MDTIEITNFTTFPGFGCGAYESVIIRFKASPVQLNLPTGTELGKNQKDMKNMKILFKIKTQMHKVDS